MKHELFGIILLDEKSRAIIKSNLSEVASNGFFIINSLNELDTDITDKTKTVIIFDGFLGEADAAVSLKLFKTLFNLEYLYLGSNDISHVVTSKLVNTYKCDITTLTLDTLLAAVHGDNVYEDNDLSLDIFSSNLEYARNVVSGSVQSEAQISSICNEYINLKSDMKYYLDEIEKLKEELRVIKIQDARLKVENEKLVTGHTKLLKDTRNLNHVLSQYEFALAKDIYQKVQLDNYPNAPVIIYMKEFERLDHFNTFLEYLQKTFVLQERKSVKILRLFDNSDCREIMTLPNYYKVLHSSFEAKDLAVSDFIVKTGDYTRVLDLLLLNRVNLDVLIVVDSKGQNDTVLSGSMLQINLCSRKDHLSCFNLEKENTVINSETDNDNEGYLCWGNYNKFDKISNPDERFLYISSRPIMQRFLMLYRLIVEQI